MDTFIISPPGSQIIDTGQKNPTGSYAVSFSGSIGTYWDSSYPFNYVTRKSTVLSNITATTDGAAPPNIVLRFTIGGLHQNQAKFTFGLAAGANELLKLAVDNANYANNVFLTNTQYPDIYENAFNSTTWTDANTEFKITYDGIVIKYYRNNSLLNAVSSSVTTDVVVFLSTQDNAAGPSITVLEWSQFTGSAITYPLINTQIHPYIAGDVPVIIG